MKIALIQFMAGLEPEENLRRAALMVKQAAGQGARAVVLPEIFPCPYSPKHVLRYAAAGHKATVEAMSRWAADNRVLLIGGSIPESEGGKLYNTCFVFDSQGRQIARYRKLHLFDVDLPELSFKESDTFAAGDEVTVFDTEYGRFGLAICFDLRFGELFRAMEQRGAKAVFVPAQFAAATGRSHWELLLRAQAVSHGLYVVGTSAAMPPVGYKSWGHSAVADPMGNIIASCDEKEQILYAELELERVDDMRRHLPVLSALRRDIYEVAK